MKAQIELRIDSAADRRNEVAAKPLADNVLEVMPLVATLFSDSNVLWIARSYQREEAVSLAAKLRRATSCLRVPWAVAP